MTKRAVTREELLEMYDAVGRFSEGLVWVRIGGQEFHVQSNGDPAYADRYDYVSPFSKGLAYVLKGKVFFQIRPNGERSRMPSQSC